MREIVLIEVPAVNVIGTKKTGTYALIPELLMKVFAHIQKKRQSVACPPNFHCYETSPAAVQEANENSTTVIEHGRSMNYSQRPFC
jgi:AraC family transcriptional regulator